MYGHHFANSVPLDCEWWDIEENIIFEADLNALTIAEGFPIEHFVDGIHVATQLRPIDSTFLIVGCGNSPTQCTYRDIHFVAPGFDEETARILIRSNIDECHCHLNAVTLDINLAKNPTIWSNYHLEFLADNTFEDCMYEGLMLPEIGSPGYLEMARVVRTFVDRYEEIDYNAPMISGSARSECETCIRDVSLPARIAYAKALWGS